MKNLITFLMIFASLSCFSKEVGEDKKSDCLAADQSKRAAKQQVASTTVASEKPAAKTISK